jgi:hypothetical protein
MTMTMTTTTTPYDRDATSLPDKNGTPVAVGDYVRLGHSFIDGSDVVEVVELHPREAHREGNVSAKLGTLDQRYSYVQVAAYQISAEPWPNVEGMTTTSRTLSGIERVDMTPDERRARRAQKINVALGNIEHRLAHYNGLRRQYEAELANLR